MAQVKRGRAAAQERAKEVYARLAAYYPNAHCTLDYKDASTLLIMTILAAQSTDARVNIVAKDLFKKYRKPADFLTVPLSELESDIKPCGFFRAKAKSIVGACRQLVEKHEGWVPGTMEELVALPGVGRKTANVVLGECFGVPAVIVDTHCTRVSNRLGFTRQPDAVKIEQDLMKVWPEKLWTQFSHLMVFHGRAICVARGPKCSQCPVNDLCPFPHSAEGKKVAR
ncbi:MAG: endonuclease III [Candidatus Hydrogenedentes bacterium]|nr:endonuclease III [Candidatus Hydrogenedentota bacterium]